MSKFGNKCTYDNIQFDSEVERDFYIKCKQLKKKGLIADFVVNPTYTLIESFTTNFPPTHKNSKEDKMEYIIDYGIYSNDGSFYLTDTKGSGYSSVEIEARNKRKMLLSMQPNIPIYFVSRLPKYLGGEFVCINPKNDFYTKLKGKYDKLYPKQKGKRRNLQDTQWTVEDWKQYFDFELKDGLFYVWKETKKEKKKKENI